MVEQEVKRQQLVAEGRIIDKAQGVNMCGCMCGGRGGEAAAAGRKGATIGKAQGMNICGNVCRGQGGGEVPHMGHVFPAGCIISPLPI